MGNSKANSESVKTTIKNINRIQRVFFEADLSVIH